MNSLLTMNRCLSILAMALSLGGVQAQDAFPDKPVKLIVPVAAGGGVDTAFRTIAPYWGELLGQQVVVENRPGAIELVTIEPGTHPKTKGDLS